VRDSIAFRKTSSLQNQCSAGRFCRIYSDSWVKIYTQCLWIWELSHST